MLPNFIIIGAAKSGTTSLFYHLSAHPEIFMPPKKELNFFIDRNPIGNWAKGQAYYESFFTPNNGEIAIGEASPRYSLDPIFKGIPQKMASIIPDVKLIYLLRNPIDQIWSHYKHEAYNAHTISPFDQLLDQNSKFLAGANYAHQIKKYLEFFSPKQLHFLLFEDYVENSTLASKDIYRFLGVNPDENKYTAKIYNNSKDKKVHRWPHLMPLIKRVTSEERIEQMNYLLMKSFYLPPMKKEVRKKLLNTFSEQRKEIAYLTKLDLSKWE